MLKVAPHADRVTTAADTDLVAPGSSSPRWCLLGLAVLTLASLAPIWVVEYFPSQNGPEYLLLSWVFRQWWNPEYGFSRFYESIGMVPPNIISQGMTALLMVFLPPLIAWKVMLSTIVLLWVAGFYTFLKTVRADAATMTLFAILLIPNYYLFKGYEAFYLSIGLFLFTVSYLFRERERWTWRNSVVLTALAVIVYYAHLFAFLMLCVVVPVHVWFRWRRTRRMSWAPLVCLVPAGLLLLHYVYCLRQFSNELVAGQAAWLRYHPIHWTLETYFYMTTFSLSWFPARLFLLPMAILTVATLVTARRTVKRLSIAASGQSQRADRAEECLLIAVVLSALYFAAPWEVAGWPKFAERFLPFVFAFLLGTATIPPRGFWRKAMAGTLIVCIAITMGFYAVKVRRVEKNIHEYVAGIPHVKPHGKLAPIHVNELVVGRIRPLRWAFNHYNIARGGATGESVIHAIGRVPLKYRDSRRAAFPSFDPLDPDAADAEAIRRAYDNILIWGDDGTTEKWFQENGFETVFAEGRLRILRRVPD